MELITIEPANALRGGKPEKTTAVLHHTIDLVAWQTIGGREILP